MVVGETLRQKKKILGSQRMGWVGKDLKVHRRTEGEGISVPSGEDRTEEAAVWAPWLLPAPGMGDRRWGRV